MVVAAGAQAVQAAQITFEDFFLSSMNIAPLKIVGFEGLWGSLAMLLVLLPLVQRLPGVDGGGLHEDSIDTLHVSGAPPSLGSGWRGCWSARLHGDVMM